MRARSNRYQSLDILRGIAILGTLGTNIWLFTDRAGMVGYIQHIDRPSGVWLWIERVLQQLAQGKFLGLLTVMFGIGLAIQQEGALRRGQPWPGRYPWRAALLFLDGVLHFVLVAEFDVLMGYAVTSVLVAAILARSRQTQRRWLITTASVHVAMLALVLMALLTTSGSSDRPKPLDPNPYADGSFVDLIEFRLSHVVLFRLEPIFISAMSIALFIAGAWLYRAGVLAESGARLRRTLMLVGLGVAAPIDLAVGITGGDAILFTRYGTAPIVALGLLAMVAEFFLRREAGMLGRRLREVGRMALSCYVLQNLVASIICYGWGFGVAARFSDNSRVLGTVAVYLGVGVVVVTFAHVWLRHFERGPVEWLWNASWRRLAAPVATSA